MTRRTMLLHPQKTLYRRRAAKAAFRTLAVASLALLLVASPAAACGSEPHDAEAETRIIKEAYSQVQAVDPRKAELDRLLPRIDVALGNLGLRGYQMHASLRGEAMSLLQLPRIPRWPHEKAEALREALSKKPREEMVGLLNAAERAWAQKRYDEAHSLLDTAIKAGNVRVLTPRC